MNGLPFSPGIPYFKEYKHPANENITLLAGLLAGTVTACAQLAAPGAAAVPFANGITAANLKKNLYIVAG